MNPEVTFADATPHAKKHSRNSSVAMRKHRVKRTRHAKNTTASTAAPKRPELKLHTPPPGAGGEELNDWFYRRRAWPNEQIDPTAYPKALAEARAMPLLPTRSGKQQTLSATLAWNSIGPYSIDGRVTAIATHPTDSNTFYVGAASGGLWKTTDHGASWTCLTDNFGSLAVGCVTVDPVQPETIYMGQGECNYSADSYPGNGLYKSTNGGRDWSYLGFGNTMYIAKLIVDPKDHRSLYVAIPGDPNKLSDSNRGVFHSADAGATWSRSLFIRLGKARTSNHVGVIDIAMNPLNSSELVAFAWDHSLAPAAGFSTGPTGPGTGIWRTSDAGTTWARIDTVASSGLPNGIKWKILSRGALLWQADGNRSYLYAAYTRGDTNEVTHYMFDANFQGLYRSTDEGLTWTKTVDSTYRIPLGGVQGKDSADMMNKQGSYNLYLAANPAYPEEVYLGGIDVLRSTDHGLTFKDISNSYSDYYVKGSRDQHSDQHGLAFTAASSGSDMIVVSDGGLFHTDDFGQSWNQLRGLPITMFYAIEPWFGGMKNTPATVGTGDLKLFGGTQDNGTVGYGLTADTNYAWINAGDGGVAIAHPTDPEKIVTSLQLGVIFVRNTLDSLRALPLTASDTSHNERPRWHTITNRLLKTSERLTDTTESCAFIAPIALDREHPSELYTGRTHVYHASVDYADPENTRWYKWSPPIAGDTAHPNHWYYGDIETIAVGAHDASGHPMLWAGGYIYAIPSSALWRTTVDPSRADSVAPHWIPVNKGLPGTTISSITPDRSDSLTAFVTTMGSTATDSVHVLRTTDGGATWTNISGNLPHAPVSALVVDTFNEHGNAALKNQYLIAATDVGVFATTNGGAKWYSLGYGLPNVVVSDLKMYKNMLVAATHGRSLYAIDLTPLDAQLSVDEAPSAEPNLTFYPNPASAGSSVHLDLGNNVSDAITLSTVVVNEATGVAVQTSMEQNGSLLTIALPHSLVSGAYVARVLSQDGRIVAQGRITVLP